MSLLFLLEKEYKVQDFIDLFGGNFQLLEQLKTTIQDEEWHAEGNVHIHTDMVLSEIYKINNDVKNNLSDNDKITLILSALLHDICKPAVTKKVNLRGVDRVIAPNHEEYGRNYLFYKLNDIVKDKVMFNDILNIVGYHHIPKLLIIKNAPLSSFFTLARKVPLKLIYLMELADMKGRYCFDKSEQVDNLELFKIVAEEAGLWNIKNVYNSERNFIYSELNNYSELTKKYVFNEYCRQFESGNIVCPEEEIARSFNYRNSFSHLIVTCGISGVGKSTYLNENYKDYNLISLDNLREELLGSRNNHSAERKVLNEAKSRLKVLLAKKENVVWDATNYRFDFRKVPLGLGFNYGAFSQSPTPKGMGLKKSTN